MAIVWDDYLTAAKNASAADKQKALDDSQALYDKQRDSLNEEYNYGIEQASKAYEDQYRTNAVQKLINERQVAENMANLGLTDSGLNRTQQTAVQLSYANNKANLDRSKQSQIDALKRERASGLSTIEQNRLTAAASIEDKYNQLASENALELYNADKEAEGQNVIYKYTGKTDDNGNLIFKNSSTGKEEAVAPGRNPYTQEKGNDSYIDVTGKEKHYGFFNNGYQPKGIYYNNVDYGAINIKDNVEDEFYGYGKKQNVWKTEKNGYIYYWVWNGNKNSYVPVVKYNGAWYENEGEIQGTMMQNVQYHQQLKSK